MNKELVRSLYERLEAIKMSDKVTYYVSDTPTEKIEKFTFKITTPFDDVITVVRETYPDHGVNISSEQASQDGVPVWTSILNSDKIINQLLEAMREL